MSRYISSYNVLHILKDNTSMYSIYYSNDVIVWIYWISNAFLLPKRQKYCLISKKDLCCL